MVEDVKPEIGKLYKIRPYSPIHRSELTIVQVISIDIKHSFISAYDNIVKYRYLSSNQPRFLHIIGGEFTCSVSGFGESFENFVSPSEIWKSLNEV